MKTFKFLLTETYSKEVEIDAEDNDSAYNLLDDMVSCGDVSALDSDDYEYDIKSMGEVPSNCDEIPDNAKLEFSTPRATYYAVPFRKTEENEESIFAVYDTNGNLVTRYHGDFCNIEETFANANL